MQQGLPGVFALGRTVKTASMLIREESGRWVGFREALRARDRRAFDRLTAYAQRHFSAISNSDLVDPFEAVMLAVLLEFEKRIEELENERKNEGRTTGLSCGGELDRALDKVGGTDRQALCEIRREGVRARGEPAGRDRQT